jgi:hypothetical protein
MTDYPDVRKCPITVCIETKRPDGNGEQKAKLQVGEWQAAQWKNLQHLVSQAGT